jgi:hypothetical protein
MTRDEYLKRFEQLPRHEKERHLRIVLDRLLTFLTNRDEATRQTHCDAVASDLLSDVDLGGGTT